MIITSIELLERSKVRVFIDNEFAFPLYKKDLNRYHLEEGLELSDLSYHLIVEECVLRRAKQKALAILKYMDRTEQEVRKKLSEADYPKKLIDVVIDYAKGYGYIDDSRFAITYLRYRKNTKSKNKLIYELYNKGVNKDIIQNALATEYDETEEEDPEIIAINKVISKKSINTNALTWEEKQKLIASLYRKGFELDKIRQIVEK